MFGFFSFSFGVRGPALNYGGISFWGNILERYDFVEKGPSGNSRFNKIFSFGSVPKLKGQDLGNERIDFSVSGYIKPQVILDEKKEKIAYTLKPEVKPVVSGNRGSVITFHPALPYYFNLYFKDRQTVHIELMFNITPAGKANSIVVKRKIASGNLEVDLLTMRYISHYLFIQQARLAPNTWQTVKIDFSPK